MAVLSSCSVLEEQFRAFLRWALPERYRCMQTPEMPRLCVRDSQSALKFWRRFIMVYHPLTKLPRAETISSMWLDHIRSTIYNLQDSFSFNSYIALDCTWWRLASSWLLGSHTWIRSGQLAPYTDDNQSNRSSFSDCITGYFMIFWLLGQNAILQHTSICNAFFANWILYFNITET